MGANYATATINADRGLKSFKLSLEQFMAKRGGADHRRARPVAEAVQRGIVRLDPAALWRAARPADRDLGHGDRLRRQRGNQNMLSSVATLAYDCRRPDYFTDQLYAALKLIDRGVLSARDRGSMHGEIGQTQFLPKNVLDYGTGNLDVTASALNSTANFLKAHGWRAGAGYQPGEPNFARHPGLECRAGLPEGHRHHRQADRRVNRTALFPPLPNLCCGAS